MAARIQLPESVVTFFAQFPLYTWESVPTLRPKEPLHPVLWIHPPRPHSQLSSDIECLRWQAYLALRDIHNVSLRWDISPEGALYATLPNLQLPDGKLLSAHSIPGWADALQNSTSDALEGFKDEESRDESGAWVSLLETVVLGALLVGKSYSIQASWKQWIYPHDKTELKTVIIPPAPPSTGLTTLLPPIGQRIRLASVHQRFSDAIASISERLGTDKWFLGSSSPTALDAMLFAYIHAILHSGEDLRSHVTRRVNLVAWEIKVRGLVQASFHSQSHAKYEK